MDRVPIQTYVMEYNEELVREAITRELARGGQVYYVYNKVRDIDEVTSRIQELVPEANVAFAHGQMRENQLEDIMYRFINGDIDVLVSTTIIETGLDISNVNTMIIHDADNMGLSQLYQLRGRVGRSNRTAYAFLMYRRNKMLKEVAEKRLAAIREYSDLGSGFKIAMRDLEIRGAGNLLGPEQSGEKHRPNSLRLPLISGRMHLFRPHILQMSRRNWICISGSPELKRMRKRRKCSKN